MTDTDFTVYHRVLRYVRETPWALRPETLTAILEVLALRSTGDRLSREEIDARVGARAPVTGTVKTGGIAVIPIHGVISHRANMFSDVSGMASIERFRARLRESLADSSIGSIVLDVDSPGGAVDGVPEMAEELRDFRGQKPIVAVANTQAASAAYWLASQADELVVSPSAEVGSIGVFAAHEDWSAALEDVGVKTTLISAGKHKVEGNPFEPLGEEARAAIQARVDDYYSMFLSAVAKGRGVKVSAVRGGFGEGRMVGAEEAVRVGMADRIATLDQTLTRLQGKPKGKAPRQAARDRFEFA